MTQCRGDGDDDGNGADAGASELPHDAHVAYEECRKKFIAYFWDGCTNAC